MPFHTMPAPLRASFRGSHVAVVGAGYLGKLVARDLVSAGCRVTATTRDASGRAGVEALGAAHEAAVFPDALHGTAKGGPLTKADLIVCCIAGSDAAKRDGPLAVAMLSEAPLVFVSSTGVYAAHDGTWLDESALTEGELSETERLLLQRPKTTVLRCGGLYGHGRTPVDWLRDETRRKRLAAGNPDAWMNWVRIEDAARAVVAACAREETGAFNIVHEPVQRRAFYDEAARIAGVEPLAFTAGGDDRGKRCSNQRARDVLELELAFPTHEQGLAAERALQLDPSPVPSDKGA